MQFTRVRFYVFVAALFMGAHAYAEDPPEVRALMKGMPPDAASFISRAVECNHWGGEEPYDKARAKEIKQAVDRLKCERLDADEQTLRRKYRGKPDIIKAMTAAKEF